MIAPLIALLLAQALEPGQSQSFSGNKTFLDDLRGKYLFTTNGLWVGGSIRSLTPGGLSIVSSRSVDDGAAAITLTDPLARTGDSRMISSYAHGVEVSRWLVSGGIEASSWFGGTAAFTDMGGGGVSLRCRYGALGCYTYIIGGMRNNSIHPAVIVGNDTWRYGGLQFGVVGFGNSDTYAAIVFGVDNQGTVKASGGIITRMRTANFPVCGVGCADGGCGPPGLLKTEFDNSATTVDDGTGTYNGVIGFRAFNYETEEDWLCTARSAQRDGGYEHIPVDYP